MHNSFNTVWRACDGVHEETQLYLELVELQQVRVHDSCGADDCEETSLLWASLWQHPVDTLKGNKTRRRLTNELTTHYHVINWPWTGGEWTHIALSSQSVWVRVILKPVTDMWTRLRRTRKKRGTFLYFYDKLNLGTTDTNYKRRIQTLVSLSRQKGRYVKANTVQAIHTNYMR